MFCWATFESVLHGFVVYVVAMFGCVMVGGLDTRLRSQVTLLVSLTMLIVATIGIVSTGPGFTLFGLVQLSMTSSGGLFGTVAEKAYILYGLLIGLAFGPVQALSLIHISEPTRL